MTKAPNLGSVYFRAHVDSDVLFLTINKEHYFTHEKKLISSEFLKTEIRKKGYDTVFAEALGRYIGQHNCDAPITITEVKRRIKKIQMVAKKMKQAHINKDLHDMYVYSDDLKRLWYEKRGQVSSLIRNYFHVRAEFEIPDIIADRIIYLDFDEHCLTNEDIRALEALIDLDLSKLYDRKVLVEDLIKKGIDKSRLNPELINDQHYVFSQFPQHHEPYLYELIKDIACIWQDLTGRTYKETSYHDKRGEKQHPFAEWIIDILRYVQAKHIPSKNSISAITRYCIVRQN